MAAQNSPTHYLPRGTRARDHACETPIFDRKGQLIAWTRQTPGLRDGLLRHARAERLVGGMLIAAYVQIDDPAKAKRAGAPIDWKEPWRCIALCADSGVLRAKRRQPHIGNGFANRTGDAPQIASGRSGREGATGTPRSVLL